MEQDVKPDELPEPPYPGLKWAYVADDVKVNEFGEPLCADCGHGHTEGAWSDRDPDDGTCWCTAGPLVCGCPKLVTGPVKKMRAERRVRETRSGALIVKEPTQ